MKVIVQNLATEYKDEGSGKVLLFLHGWQSTLQSFDALASSLASQYRIVTLDLPGFGKSEIPKCDWDLDMYVNFLSDFIKKLHLDVYALGGHSFGGRITIKGIAEKKLEAKKIILIGSAGIAKRKTLRNYFFMLIAKLGKFITYLPPLYFFREILRKKMYSFVGSDYLSAGVLKNTFLKVIKEDLSEDARKITIPALLIWGSDDSETPLTDGKQLSLFIKNSQLEVVLDAGHFVHSERPNEVSKLIQKFL